MRYEVSKDLHDEHSWRVEAIGRCGVSYTAYFSGLHAEQRAKYFAIRKNGLLHMRAA